MRIDQASLLIRAPRQRVFEAFVTKAAVATWLPPAGAQAIVHEFYPRPGGAFRMTLLFDNDVSTPGKTTRNSDTVEGIFVDLAWPERIEQKFTFVSDDPKYAGAMLMTWTLTEEREGTRVTVVATDVPDGINPEDHRKGMVSSLSNLATYVENSGSTGVLA